MFVVYSPEEESILEHRHGVVQSAFLFEFFIANYRIGIVFYLINPRFLFEAANSVTESFLLSPENFLGEDAWECNVDSLTEMVLFDTVSGALDVGRQVEVVLHESLV